MSMHNHYYLAWGVDLGERDGQWREDHERLASEHGCTLVLYGDCGGSCLLAVRDSVRAIEDAGLHRVDGECFLWRDRLRAALRALELSSEDPPAWHIAGWWG